MSKTPSEKANGRPVAIAEAPDRRVRDDSPIEGIGSAEAPDAASARALFHRRAGQLFLALARLERYRTVAVGDLKALFLQPLIEDRIAFAHREGEDTSAMPTGMAVWASVSDTISERIAADANAGTFPVRLAADDWTSGETVWLLDLIVPDKRAGTAVFMNFGTLIEGRSFRVHPVVWHMVDESITRKFADLQRQAAPVTAH